MSILKCNFCQKTYTPKGITNHLVRVHLNEFNSFNEAVLYGIKLRYNLSEKDIDNILNDYKDNSALYIKEKYGLSYKGTQTILLCRNIKI